MSLSSSYNCVKDSNDDDDDANDDGDFNVDDSNDERIVISQRCRFSNIIYFQQFILVKRNTVNIAVRPFDTTQPTTTFINFKRTIFIIVTIIVTNKYDFYNGRIYLFFAFTVLLNL